MSLYTRLVVLLFVWLAVFSPEYGLAEKCKEKFYTVSLKDSYAKKKRKVRAFFLDPGSNVRVYSIPKMPDGWHYAFNSDNPSDEFIAAAYTDKDAVDIGFFKDFLSFMLWSRPNERAVELHFSMTLICLKQDGTTKIITLDTKDFEIKEIHKRLKEY